VFSVWSVWSGTACQRAAQQRDRRRGRPIWFTPKDAKTRGQIEFLFAEVEHLPIVFNQADTAAEANGQTGGLCSALVPPLVGDRFEGYTAESISSRSTASSSLWNRSITANVLAFSLGDQEQRRG
jgi:hypothetical protein